MDRADSPSSLPVDTSNDTAIYEETHDRLIPKGNSNAYLFIFLFTAGKFEVNFFRNILEASAYVCFSINFG